jgi:hypothetical protein
MSTELKTESWYRYMLYRKEDYSKGIFFTREEKRDVEAGCKFTMAAYPDVWARDAGLVKRVRQFLGANFYWHDRLSKSGSDLEVMQTLRDMVRGGSVVVIPETMVSGGGVGSNTRAPAAPAPKSFFDLVMEWMGLSYEEATKYVDDYNDRVARLHEVIAQHEARVAASRADDGGNFLTRDGARTSTSLRDARPLKYGEETVSSDAEELAASTSNPKFAAKMLGYDQNTFSKMLHEFKPENGLRPSDNFIWHDDGSVEFNGAILNDNMHNYAP